MISALKASASDAYGCSREVPHSRCYPALKLIELLHDFAVARILDLVCSNSSLCGTRHAAERRAIAAEPDEAGVAVERASNPSLLFPCFGRYSDASQRLALQGPIDVVLFTEVVSQLFAPGHHLAYAAAVLKFGGASIMWTPWHGNLKSSVLWGRASLAAGLHQPVPALAVNQTIPLAMGALFRRSALPPELPAHAGLAYDLWLAYLLCRQGDGAWYHPERLSSWSTHSGNLTSAGNVDWLNGAATCWREASEVPLFAPWKRAMRRKAAQGFSACAVRSWARGGSRAAGFRFALRSLSVAPSLKGLAALCLPVLPRRCAGARWQNSGPRVASSVNEQLIQPK